MTMSDPGKMAGTPAAAAAGARSLLLQCGSYQQGEHVVIVCDASTRAVADLVAAEAQLLQAKVDLVETVVAGMHGEEPTEDAAAAMKQADLILGLRAKSMAHTRARFAATEGRGRYLSLPDFSIDLLADPSLQVDYRAARAAVVRLSDAFTAGNSVRVQTETGTDIVMDIRGRIGNCCPGYVDRPGELGSPPDIEANVSPVEDASEGVVVVDGSVPFPGFGLVSRPFSMTVRGGKVVSIDGDADMVQRLNTLFDGYGTDKTRILAECGIGLNPKASLTGVMLTDEGAYGTMHFGFGSNATVGGKNDVPFHVDFVFRKPTLSIDGVVFQKNGVLTA